MDNRNETIEKLLIKDPAIMKRAATFTFLFLVWSLLVYGKGKDSIPVPHHWNVIKINPTPAIIFGNLGNVSIGYERLFKSNQSVQFQLGYLWVSPLLDSVGRFMDINRVSNFGLNVALDYRYYPLRRNQYPAPDGLYLGTYLSYYGFQFKDEFAYYLTDTVKASGSYSSNYNIINRGCMLGYQFIFWKRLSVDLLIFGPSLTCRISSWQVSNNVDNEDEKELLNKIREKFNEKYPLLVPFIQPNAGKQSAEFKMFFRYSISVGFHF